MKLIYTSAKHLTAIRVGPEDIDKDDEKQSILKSNNHKAKLQTANVQMIIFPHLSSPKQKGPIPAAK